MNKYCKYCGKVLPEKSKNIFCNRSCACTYNNLKRGPKSDISKYKCRISLINFYNKKGHKKRKCVVCGKEYVYEKGTSTKKVCSIECSNYLRTHRKDFLSKESIDALREAGKKSARLQKNKRRSKNEIYFYNLCKNFYKDVIHNEPIFNGWDADVIIPIIKVAVLWNGPWHYKEIIKGNTLKQIQNRDKIKIKEIKKSGYIPYIIKDMGKYNTKFVEQEFNKFISIYNLPS